MKKLFYFCLLIYFFLSKIAVGQAETLANIGIGGSEYRFLCEGEEGTSRIR